MVEFTIRPRNSCSGTTATGRRIGRGLRSLRTCLACLIRCSALPAASRPGTPLRVLCIAAFDMLHRVRLATPLASERVRMIAALLDFGAAVNAELDEKPYSRRRCSEVYGELQASPIGPLVVEYLHRLQDLERHRPEISGDVRQLQRARVYREDVIRLSLGTVASAAFGFSGISEGIEAIPADAGLRLLFQLVMQCQVIDDLMDFSSDSAAGRPGFLTTSTSLVHAFELTRVAVHRYAACDAETRTSELFGLRLALCGLSAVAGTLVTLGRWRQRVPQIAPLPQHVL